MKRFFQPFASYIEENRVSIRITAVAFNTFSEPIQLQKILKKVREFICVVYTASQPFGAGFFVCLSTVPEVRHQPSGNRLVFRHLQNIRFPTLYYYVRFGTALLVTISPRATYKSASSQPCVSSSLGKTIIVAIFVTQPYLLSGWKRKNGPFMII